MVGLTHRRYGLPKLGATMAGHLIRVEIGSEGQFEDYAVGIADTAEATRRVLQYTGGRNARSVFAYSDDELWEMWGVKKGGMKPLSTDRSDGGKA